MGGCQEPLPGLADALKLENSLLRLHEGRASFQSVDSVSGKEK